MIRTQDLLSFMALCITYSGTAHIYHGVHCRSSSHLSYNEVCTSFTSHSSKPPHLVTTNLFSFFLCVCCLFHCFWGTIYLLYYISSLYVIRWFSISIHFKMITTISLGSIYHHTKILLSYWLHYKCTMSTVHFIPMSHLFCTQRFVPVNLPHLFLSFPSPLWKPSVDSLYLWFFLFCYVYSFCFLDSLYKWKYKICPSLSDLFHLYPLGLSMFSQMARFHCLYG